MEGASSDSDKVFRCWSYEQSSGLEPFSDYVKNIYSPYIYFSMPQNDVSLVAEYMDRQKSAAILLEKPEAGKLLNTKGEIQWEGKVAGSKTVDVSWYEKKGDIYTPATGVAEAGVTYVAKLAIAQDAENGLAFAFDMDSIKASMDGGQTASKVDSYSVDDVGTLNVSISCAVDKETAESIEPESVTVFAGISQAALKDALPSKAFVRAYSGASFYVDIDKDNADLSGLIDDGKVVKPEGGKLTIEIPVSSNKVYFPDDLDTVKVEVTVEDAPEEEIATPELSPAGGTYSTKDDASKFVDGKLKVEASCETEDASIKYKLSYLKDGEWVDDSEKTYSNSIDLDVYEGKQRSYKLEVWAAKSSLESAHATQYYLIDDMQPDEMVTATVKYVDTAMEGHHAGWADSTKDYLVKKGQDFVITASTEEGYAFEKWLDDEGNVLGAEPALLLEKLDENIKITCVYNPVVTELDLGFDLPEAHKELSAEAGYVNAKIADSDEVQDVSEYFKKDGKLALSWQPSGDSEGKAEHNIAYLAALSLAGQVDGVKYTLSSRLTFKINHNKVEGGVYVGKKDDLPALFIECPSTGPYEYKSIADVSDVELSFQQAWAYNANQEAGKAARWGLPKGVEVAYKCGEAELLSIEWDKVEGFDKDAKAGQELTATGKVCYPSYVDNDGAPETVSVKIAVAAPEKAKAPEASLAPGTYTGTQYVQLGCSADGAVIRYTTDGSEPTEESPVYSGEQIEIASSMTIKARSYAQGYLESDAAEFTYVIEGADPEPGPDPEPTPEPDPEPTPEPEDGGSDSSASDESNTEEGSESSGDSESGTEEATPATGDIPVAPFAMGASAFACALIVLARRRACR